MPEKFIKRLTLDIDGYKKLKENLLVDFIVQKQLYKKAKRIEKKLLFKYKFTSVESRLSPSGRGLHIIAWHDVGFTKEKILKIRIELGDDVIRVLLDSKTGRDINVLFEKKETEEVNK
jgi:hypothetical protein